MVIRLKRPRTRSLALVLLCFLFTAAAVLQHLYYDYTAKMVSVPFEEQQISEKLLTYLFISGIQEQSEQFYEPYYTISPSVAYYSTTVKELQEDGTNICITFTVLPYIGPHDTIGEDEVTFCIDHSGAITDTRFRHLRNYSLPDNLSHLKKGLPPVSG
ncbi:MAG: DUF3888 domain-containing protein [Oscillospiraceae bacterium]